MEHKESETQYNSAVSSQMICNGDCPECWETDCPDSPNYYRKNESLEECTNCGVLLDEDEHDIQESVEFTGVVFRFCCLDCMAEWEDEQAAGCYDNYDDPMYDDFNPYDFRDPGGRSALRNGPRIHPCPNCGEPNVLTPRDVQLHYQCDRCADALERGW